MFLKKLVSVGLLLVLLCGCAQNTASLLGPVYTLGSTGNIYQAGLSYGSDTVVTKITGKSIGKNLTEVLKENNLNQKSLEKDKELRQLIKIRITEVRKRLNLSN